MTERILVMCAHSDDQILGPGGTIVKYSKQGKEVKTIIFSYGEKSHPHLKKEIIIMKRVKEAQEADKIIGGKGVTFLALTEGRFKKEIEQKHIISKIIKIIKDFKPDKIFTHSDEDNHPDHKIVSKTTIEIVDKMKFKGDVYIFDVWNLLRLKKRDMPKMYVDISDTFSTKLKALNCFESQWMAMLMLKWSVYVKAIRHGLNLGVRFAERFYKIR